VVATASPTARRARAPPTAGSVGEAAGMSPAARRARAPPTAGSVGGAAGAAPAAPRAFRPAHHLRLGRQIGYAYKVVD